MELLELKVTNSVPLIKQVEAAECGLACIAMIANYFNHRTDMRDMRKSYTSGLKSMTLKNIIQTAESMGMANRLLQASLDEVEKLQTPYILHWKKNGLHAIMEFNVRLKNWLNKVIFTFTYLTNFFFAFSILYANGSR